MALNFQQHEPASAGRLSLIIALAVSLVCVGLYQAEGATGPLHSLQSAVEGAMVPLQRASAPLTEAVDDAGAAAAEGGVTEETYATLRQQNEQLVQQLAAAEEQRLENERLRGLLNLRDTYEITGVSGRVIGRTTDAWNQTVTLDVGSSSGVETGLTVLGPTGVVGQVISVDGGSCRVRLLTDPQSGAAAMVQSSRAEGIVRGSMDGLLYLENIGADVNVQVGDVVLTSGLGGSYTRGLSHRHGGARRGQRRQRHPQDRRGPQRHREPHGGGARGVLRGRRRRRPHRDGAHERRRRRGSVQFRLGRFRRRQRYRQR